MKEKVSHLHFLPQKTPLLFHKHLLHQLKKYKISYYQEVHCIFKSVDKTPNIIIVSIIHSNQKLESRGVLVGQCKEINLQDIVNNYLSCLLYNSYDIHIENLVSDQIIVS